MQNQKTETNSKNQIQLNAGMDQCIQNCLTCFRVCEETLARYFSVAPGIDSSFSIILRSCSEICQTSAKFMIMSSSFHQDVCGVCSKVCKECADSCEEIGDVSMKECIDACRKCSESCIEMSKMPH